MGVGSADAGAGLGAAQCPGPSTGPANLANVANVVNVVNVADVANAVRDGEHGERGARWRTRQTRCTMANARRFTSCLRLLAATPVALWLRSDAGMTAGTWRVEGVK